MDPIKQERLDEQYAVLTQREGVPCRQIAMQLARFTEAVAIGNANRVIEELRKKLPKPLALLPNDLLDGGDFWKIHFKLRSELFDYFLWRLDAATAGSDIATLADEGLRLVDELFLAHINKEKE